MTTLSFAILNIKYSLYTVLSIILYTVLCIIYYTILCIILHNVLCIILYIVVCIIYCTMYYIIYYTMYYIIYCTMYYITVVPQASVHLYVTAHPLIFVLKGKCKFPMQVPTSSHPLRFVVIVFYHV